MSAAVITGASSGIGRECTKILLEKKLFKSKIDKIYLLARRKEVLDDFANKYADGIEIKTIRCDISKSEDIDNFSQILNRENPDISLLINSAGLGKNGDFADISPDDNISMIDVNCRGLVAMTQICLKFMKGGAKILNISSVAGFAPLARFAVYGATKAFVTSFSIGLSVELEKRNISVTVCAPGSVDTEFHKIARGGTGISKRFYSKKAPVEKVAKLALDDTYKGKLFSSFGAGASIARVFGGIVPKRAFARFSYKNIYV